MSMIANIVTSAGVLYLAFSRHDVYVDGGGIYVTQRHSDIPMKVRVDR